MVLHMAAYIAKLNLLSSSSHSLSPMVASLVLPFLLKLSFGFTIVRRTYSDLLHASRLFLFQVGRIAFEREVADNIGNNRSRLERALRLISERVTLVRRSQVLPSDNEDSFLTLSMIALWTTCMASSFPFFFPFFSWLGDSRICNYINLMKFV